MAQKPKGQMLDLISPATVMDLVDEYQLPVKVEKLVDVVFAIQSGLQMMIDSATMTSQHWGDRIYTTNHYVVTAGGMSQWIDGIRKHLLYDLALANPTTSALAKAEDPRITEWFLEMIIRMINIAIDTDVEVKTDSGRIVRILTNQDQGTVELAIERLAEKRILH